MYFPWCFKILNVSFLHMLYAASRGELCAMQLWVICRHWNPTNIISLEHQTLTLKNKFIADTKYKNLPKYCSVFLFCPRLFLSGLSYVPFCHCRFVRNYNSYIEFAMSSSGRSIGNKFWTKHRKNTVN